MESLILLLSPRSCLYFRETLFVVEWFLELIQGSSTSHTRLDSNRQYRKPFWLHFISPFLPPSPPESISSNVFFPQFRVRAFTREKNNIPPSTSTEFEMSLLMTGSSLEFWGNYIWRLYLQFHPFGTENLKRVYEFNGRQGSSERECMN